jgi:hypothetical protein
MAMMVFLDLLFGFGLRMLFSIEELAISVLMGKMTHSSLE